MEFLRQTLAKKGKNMTPGTIAEVLRETQRGQGFNPRREKGGEGQKGDRKNRFAGSNKKTS